MNSQGMGRCTLFSIEAVCGVSAANPYEFLGFRGMHLLSIEALCGMSAAKALEFRVFGEMHLVFD